MPALDALRGIAVIGIVPMNVLVFAMPSAAYVNPGAYGGTGPLATAVWALVFLAVEDKFRALFAMMFGAGVAILVGRARERGERRPLGAHYARMAVLFAIGFVHATLLADNDILRLYALAGLVLPLFLRLGARTLLWSAAALIAAQLAVSGYLAWGWVHYWWQWHTGAVADFSPLIPAERMFGADADTLAAALERGREAFGERLARRLGSPLTPLLTAAAALPSTLAAMLIGIALWRCRLLAGGWPRARLLRLAGWLVLIALPPLVALAAVDVWSGFAAVPVAANGLVWSAPFDILLATGWAALAMALLGGSSDAGGGERPLAARLAAVGRMALSNYLATSLVFAAIFHRWGMGLFGEVDRVAAMAICLVPVALMLAWSPWWLARFRQGPLEWLWRSAASARLLPLRR